MRPGRAEHRERIALTRAVPRSLERCELTHRQREPIDLARAARQHLAYEACLGACGCTVVRLPTEDEMPDSVFVEDTAVVLDEIAVVARPGAASRRLEVRSTAEGLASYRQTVAIEPPGTLDGGDVLLVGRMLYVGRSSRTNEDGIEQLRRTVGPFGYGVQPVPVAACLHLKSAVTRVGVTTLLINPAWIDARAFGAVDVIEVDPSEPAAANALWVGDTVIQHAGYPRTRARLKARGLCVESLDMSETVKAEGGVTCCSVIFAREAP